MPVGLLNNLFHSQSHHRTQKPTASFQRQEQILFGKASKDDKMSPEKKNKKKRPGKINIMSRERLTKFFSG